MDRPLVVLDTETATTRGAPHLLELGAIRVEDGEVVDRFEALVLPQVPIEPDAEAVHGITEDDVRGAEPAGPVLARFAAWAGDTWLVAHDAARDADVLGFEAARHRAPVPAGPFLDTLKLARRHLPDAPDHRLETLVAHLELEGTERHRALPDAVACWKVLEACVERASEEEPPSASALLAACGAPLTVAPPRPPRIKPRWRRIAAACETGATVRLVYGDDAEEPALLPVRPILLYESGKKGYLEAECGLSGILKTYRLDRVHKVLPA